MNNTKISLTIFPNGQQLQLELCVFDCIDFKLYMGRNWGPINKRFPDLKNDIFRPN